LQEKGYNDRDGYTLWLDKGLYEADIARRSRIKKIEWAFSWKFDLQKLSDSDLAVLEGIIERFGEGH